MKDCKQVFGSVTPTAVTW